MNNYAFGKITRSNPHHVLIIFLSLNPISLLCFRNTEFNGWIEINRLFRNDVLRELKCSVKTAHVNFNISNCDETFVVLTLR